MAVIELSPETPAHLDPGGPPPAWVYRRLGLLLAAVLVLALGGAAPGTPVLWERTGVLTTGQNNDVVTSGDGRFYVLDFDRTPPVITAWSTGPVEELWRVTGPPGDAAAVRYAMTAVPGGSLLVDVAGKTTVLDPRTGKEQWHADAPVTAVGAGTALVRVEHFRPGTEYDVDSGDPGALYGTGTLHTEPAQRTELRGVEQATGKQLWSTVLPGSVYATVSGQSVVVVTATSLRLLDARTGRVVRERAVAGPTWVETVADSVLLHYGAYGTGGRVVAVAAGTLDERWTSDLPDFEGSSVSCAGLVCAKGRDDVAVLDPATGARLWTLPSTEAVDLVAFGRSSVLWSQTGAIRSVVDRRTGKPLADTRSWPASAATPGGEAYLLTRKSPSQGMEFALLRPGRAPQLLGSRPEFVTSCRVDAGFAVCRDEDRLMVYRYRG
ncbi:outer membrane protein assembly factor BamB family protein [Symbioplanes lichenis]|uniref:outer membrane protein assembly factor BamB family protein n=1 Tax=Symbioplanes lichenis TaxID=1629072 RepID=UPI00273A21AD|nr:PQQ-binding-like beta-propeller repeat protein [Actinoplanes lichenis]